MHSVLKIPFPIGNHPISRRLNSSFLTISRDGTGHNLRLGDAVAKFHTRSSLRNGKRATRKTVQRTRRPEPATLPRHQRVYRNILPALGDLESLPDILDREVSRYLRPDAERQIAARLINLRTQPRDLPPSSLAGITGRRDCDFHRARPQDNEPLAAVGHRSSDDSAISHHTHRSIWTTPHHYIRDELWLIGQHSTDLLQSNHERR